MQTERRKHPRTSVRLNAVVVLGEGVERLAGAVTDISEAGARLHLDHPPRMAGAFYILLPEHGLHPCQLVWRSNGSMGLSFLKPS